MIAPLARRKVRRTEVHGLVSTPSRVEGSSPSIRGFAQAGGGGKGDGDEICDDVAGFQVEKPDLTVESTGRDFIRFRTERDGEGKALSGFEGGGAGAIRGLVE